MKAWRKKLIESFKAVDVEENDWAYDLIKSIPSDYVRGYIQAKYDHESDNNWKEELRDELIGWLSWDSWDEYT